MTSTSSTEEFQDAVEKPADLCTSDSEEYSDSDEVAANESFQVKERSDERFRSLFSELFDLFDKKVDEVQRLREKIKGLESKLKEQKQFSSGQSGESKFEKVPAYPIGSATCSSFKSASKKQNESVLEKQIEILIEKNNKQTDELTFERIENQNLLKKVADMEISLKASKDFHIYARTTLDQYMQENKKLIEEVAILKIGKLYDPNFPTKSNYQVKGTSTDIKGDSLTLQVRDQESIIASQLEEIKKLSEKIVVLESNNATILNDVWDDFCESKLKVTKVEKERDEAISKLSLIEDEKHALELQLSLLLCDDIFGPNQLYQKSNGKIDAEWITNIRNRATSSYNLIVPEENTLKVPVDSKDVAPKSQQQMPESSKTAEVSNSKSVTAPKSEKLSWNLIKKTLKGLDSIKRVTEPTKPNYYRLVEYDEPSITLPPKKEEDQKTYTSAYGFKFTPIFSNVAETSKFAYPKIESAKLDDSKQLDVSQQIDNFFSSLLKENDAENKSDNSLSPPPAEDLDYEKNNDDVDDQIETIDKEVSGLKDRINKLTNDFDEEMNLSTSSEESYDKGDRRSSVSSNDSSWEKVDENA